MEEKMKRNFTDEIDTFFYGGYADELMRTPKGTFVKPYGQEDFIPVEDWKKKYQFLGGRGLEHLAKWFYEMGLRDGLDQKINAQLEKFTMKILSPKQGEGGQNPSGELLRDQPPNLACTKGEI